jgi:hypothetical protein
MIREAIMLALSAMDLEKGILAVEIVHKVTTTHCNS